MQPSSSTQLFSNSSNPAAEIEVVEHQEDVIGAEDSTSFAEDPKLPKSAAGAAYGSSLKHPLSVSTMKDYMKSSDFKELVLCGCTGIFFWFIGYVADEPRQRPIPKQVLDDGSIIIEQMYNNHVEDGKDTVPDWMLGFLCVAIGPLIQFAVSLLRGEARDLHRSVCVYILAVPLNELISWLTKAYVGYLRPHFYEGCVPNETYDYCLDPDGLELDMRSSFPSGHASWSFVSMTLLYLYLERTLGVSSIERAYVVNSSCNYSRDTSTRIEAAAGGEGQQQRPLMMRMQCQYHRPPTIYRFISILCLGPLLFAGFIAASRVADNRHHPADVVAGSIIGASVAYFFHTSW